ncbi:uncharacterized protein (UPF0254 family) [Methanococcus maripaludis]|uniref:UPF0254 protein HNP86_000795 n=1 Tax=Methanococcus maripaludis TaxID=39152 RepID=A0A7J9NTM8_METMI|nr:UPF0254 family protein [Methanococcus maripaludis]MBA2850664.1 uncharacterized protein (UPF0254 family) [Methanococcus maripaludis]
MISVATAECFTHGKIGTKIHKIACGYKEFEKDSNYDMIHGNVYVMASMFLPSKKGIESLLDVKLPEPDYVFKYSKAYNQENDILVAKLVAKALKNKLNCNIAISSTAGIGNGAVCIVTDYNDYVFSSDIYGDLLKGQNIIKRQESGIEKAYNTFIDILKKEYNLK